MTNFVLTFTHPWLLFLLIPAIGVALVPFFLIPKKYRRNRNRIASLVLHCVAITLAVILLCGVSYSYDLPNKENELILLVDCSHSSESSIAEKDEFIQSVVNISEDNYKIGIVKFGYDQIYAAELSNDADEVFKKYLQSADPDTSATDVAAALQYASGLFKSPKTSKIVLISDGIETDGAAMSVIKQVAAEGIKVDTAYFPNQSHDEVQIVGVKMPEYKISLDQEFTIEVDLKSNFEMPELTDEERFEHPEIIEQNTVFISLYDNDELVKTHLYELKKDEPAKITHKIKSTDSKALGLHKLRFEIRNSKDVLIQNNSYYSYIMIAENNKILLIERRSGESQPLQELLSYRYDVTALGIDQHVADIPKTIKELCKYEQVILVNIANSDMPSGFDEILYKYVNQFGGGLFTVGGENDEVDGQLVPHAYDSNDLANTLFAEMLPVQAIDYTPPIAVMIVIDCSGSMSMGKFEQAQTGAKACLDSLSSRDFCGVISFDTEAGEDVSVLPVSQKDKIIKAINEVGKGEGAGSGGTVFSTAIDNAGRALAAVNVERRHIIIVTDGNPTDSLEEYGPIIDNNVKGGITMSVVGIQIDPSNVENMEKTCERGGGKFYNVPASELNNLPNIMHDDMEGEAVAGIKYGEEFVPTIRDHTAIFKGDNKDDSEENKGGISQEDIPPLSGYYGTRVKDGNVLVPLMGKFVPIYAEWKFGAGTVGSFMCDLEGIWSEKFLNDITGQTLIYNIVKGLFPSQAIKTDEIDALVRQDNHTVQISVSSVRSEGETIAVTVTPITEEAIEFYSGGIAVFASDGLSRFTCEITCPGLYEITISKLDANGGVLATLKLDYAFSYSQEYNYFPTRELMGEEFMEALAADGRGIVVEYAIDVFDTFDKYIHKTVDPRIGLLIAVIVLFLLDVAVRKFKFKWPHELIREYRQKKKAEENKN